MPAIYTRRWDKVVNPFCKTVEKTKKIIKIYEIYFLIFSKRAQCMISIHALNLSSLIELSRDTYH